jgi:hypothetical protein
MLKGGFGGEELERTSWWWTSQINGEKNDKQKSYQVDMTQ